MIWLEIGIALAAFAIFGVTLRNRLLREKVRSRTAELRDTEARLKAQFAHSPIPIFCWQRTGDDFTMIDLNEAAAQLYGGAPHANIGARASTVLARWPEGLALLHQCARERRTLTHTGKRPVAQHGLTRWKTATFVFLPPDMVLVHSEDITEQKETEIALRESEERYRQLIHHSLDGMIVRDETNYVFANDAAARVMGMESADQLIGTSWLDRVPPERREEAVRTFRLRIDSRDPSSVNERRLVRPDGTTVDIQVWATPIEWEGRPALFGMFRDITEKKRTEFALRESEQRYRDLIELSLDGVMVRDEDRYLYANDAAARIFGFDSADRLEGTSWHQFIRPDELESAKARFQEMLAEDARHELVARTWHRADGSAVEVETWAKPIEWQGRRVLLGMVRDVSERARRERELRELTESLLRAQEETRRAQEELVRSERLAVLGQLSASMSHELRNPLGVIATSLAIVETRAKDADLGLEPAIERMKRSVTRCDRIIADMLDYARDQAPRIEKVDINAWLADVLNELELPGRIGVRREFGEFAGPVEFDPELMRRAVINLCANARDAILDPDGTGPDNRQNVLTARTAMADGCATIAISDTGPGMPIDMVGRSFEPLFSTKAFGVGLGLPIVKKIVEQHQGRITIENESDRGAVVTISIPMRHAKTELAVAS